MLLLAAMVVLMIGFWVSAFRGEAARSPDGRIELSLPPDGDKLYVRSSPKQNFEDLGNYDADEQRKVLAWLSDARSSGAEDALVNGRAALRSEITGTTPRGVRVDYVMMALETETRFTEPLVATDQSRLPYLELFLANIRVGKHPPANRNRSCRAHSKCCSLMTGCSSRIC